MNAPLYNLEILRLAASTANLHRLKDAQASVEKRSPTCGSRVLVEVTVDSAGRIADLGVDLSACALGQASAALMAAHALGHTDDEMAAASDALRAYLEGQAESPGDWPGLDVFAPARAHSARHPSIMLAFKAAAEAAAAATRS